MLLVLIPIAWLACIGLLLALCRMAARGDAQPARSPDQLARSLGDGLTVWEDPPEVVLQDRRRGAATQEQQLTAHGVR
jgi:hypothetical protein